MTERLVIDQLEFELRRSPRRRTVGVTVDRGGELILHAPDDCELEAIERVARDKRLWVHTKLARKELLDTRQGTKEYVSGEGFHYLGRSYRLRLVDDAPRSLRLYRGGFELGRAAAPRGEEHFRAWYRSHAAGWLTERLERWTPRFGVAPRGVEVRALGNRWASCTSDGRLLFHWRAILLPPAIIDYLIVHELAHLREPHHSAAFWQQVERAMPDFRPRLQWLAEHGAAFNL